MATDWRRLHGIHFVGQRALVTGGAGFIGSHIVRALTQLGAEVVVLDDLSAGRRENLAGLPLKEFIGASILDREAVALAMRGVQVVFHQAAMASVPLSVERPREFYEINVMGTLNVLQAAAEAKVRRVTFAARSRSAPTPPARSPAKGWCAPGRAATASTRSRCVTSTSSAPARAPTAPTPP